jgi:hypothetical protein
MRNVPDYKSNDLLKNYSLIMTFLTLVENL